MKRVSGDGIDEEMGRANARLIAAAPDLLAACKLAANHIQDGYSKVEACAVMEAIVAAIARAEGGKS